MKIVQYLENTAYNHARPSQYQITPEPGSEKEFFFPNDDLETSLVHLGKPLSDTKAGKMHYSCLQTKNDIVTYIYNRQQQQKKMEELNRSMERTIAGYTKQLQNQSAESSLNYTITLARKRVTPDEN